jgi:hypothetical protein
MPWEELAARLLERSLGRLREALTNQQLDIKEGANGDRIVRLPSPTCAEYSFELWFYGPTSGGSGGRHVIAILPGRPSNEVFWSCPFEPESFFRKRSTPWKEALEGLAQAFDEFVADLVRSPTRIIQQRGILNWKFALEVQMPDGSWLRKDTHYMFRLGFRVPPIDGRERVYSAPAIAPPAR